MAGLLIGIAAVFDLYEAYNLIVDERVRLLVSQRVPPGT
jgi:hypothetical protein